MEHVVEHPIDLTFEELLEAAMDRLDPDSDAFGIARMVLADPDQLDTLTPNRRYHWDAFVNPAIERVIEARNVLWRQHLWDRAG
jgi:hypothetical protein